MEPKRTWAQHEAARRATIRRAVERNQWQHSPELVQIQNIAALRREATIADYQCAHAPSCVIPASLRIVTICVDCGKITPD